MDEEAEPVQFLERCPEPENDESENAPSTSAVNISTEDDDDDDEIVIAAVEKVMDTIHGTHCINPFSRFSPPCYIQLIVYK